MSCNPNVPDYARFKIRPPVYYGRRAYLLDGENHAAASQAIRPLVHPAPVIAVHMSKSEEEPSPNTDAVLSGPADFDAATVRILDELKRRGVLAQVIGAKPIFQYSI